MSAKLVLDTAAMQEDFFADTALIGILTPLPAYSFCWLLNEQLATCFTKHTEEIVLRSPGQEEHFFPLYQYAMPALGSKFSIYKLKSGKQVLLPEVKQLDYLWMIESAAPDTDAGVYLRHLKAMPEVQLAQILSPGKLKNLNHLLV